MTDFNFDFSKVAAYVPASNEVLDDAGWTRNTVTVRRELIGDFLIPQMDRFVFPWKYPDAPVMPAIDPFPRLTRWQARARTVAGIPSRIRRRIRDVADVARHGLPEHDEDRW